MGSKRVPNPGKPTSFPCTIQERMEFRVATIHFRPIEIRVVEREREKKRENSIAIPESFVKAPLSLRLLGSLPPLPYSSSLSRVERKNFPTKKEREREIDK